MAKGRATTCAGLKLGLPVNPRAQARALLQAPYLSLTPKQQISARSAFMRLFQLCPNTNLGLAEGGGCRTIALGLSGVLLQGAPLRKPGTSHPASGAQAPAGGVGSISSRHQMGPGPGSLSASNSHLSQHGLSPSGQTPTEQMAVGCVKPLASGPATRPVWERGHTGQRAWGGGSLAVAWRAGHFLGGPTEGGRRGWTGRYKPAWEHHLLPSSNPCDPQSYTRTPPHLRALAERLPANLRL